MKMCMLGKCNTNTESINDNIINVKPSFFSHNKPNLPQLVSEWSLIMNMSTQYYRSSAYIHLLSQSCGSINHLHTDVLLETCCSYLDAGGGSNSID